MTAPTALAPSSDAIEPAASVTQKLFDARGPSYPALGPDSSPQAKADFVTALLTDTENDAMTRYKRATQCLLFSDGRQHIDWTQREKLWKDTNQPEGRIYVTMNYIRPLLRSRMQRMVSSELMWRVVPSSNDYEDRDRATTYTNFVESRWEKTDMEGKIRLGLWFAFHCGVSALKSFWNPHIGPLTPATMILPHAAGKLVPPVDEKTGQPNPAAGQPLMVEYPVNKAGEPLADENGDPAPVNDAQVFRYRPGDTDTALRTVFNLRLNPDASGFLYDEGFRWMLDSDLVPLSVVKERYGDRAAKVTSIAGSTAGRNYERIIKSLSGLPGLTSPISDILMGKGNAQPFDKEPCLLTEYWEHPTELLPQGRLIVVAGNELLYPLEDDEEGLPQGFMPFAPIYDEKRPFDWGGRGVCEDLIAPQKVINRQWEGELEEQMRHGIGQWIMWGVPGLSNQITNLSGAHIEIPTTTAMANRSIGDVVQRVPPPGFNPSRWRLLEEAKATMFDIGAFHEIQRGQVPPGVDSGIAIQYLQEAENAQLHDPVRNLKSSLKLWARHQGKIGRWGYEDSEERWIPVHRPDLGFLVESVKGADIPDPDEIDIDLEGFRPTSQAAQRAEIKELMDKGQIPIRQGLLLMDLGRGIEGIFESATRHYARARRENLAIEKGEVLSMPTDGDLAHIPTAGLGYALVHPDQTPLLLPADDEHAIHIPIHQDIALNDTIPWPIRQIALLHIAEHRTMAAAQLAGAAAAQGEGEDGEKKGEEGGEATDKPEGEEPA